MATAVSTEDAYALLGAHEPLNGKAFGILGRIAKMAANDENDFARDLLIRLLEHRDDMAARDRHLLNSLVIHLGLYPYVPPPDADQLPPGEAIALEYHRPPAFEGEDFIFHAMQQAVYQRLIAGESVVLSAPTSFGKSVIMDALVASRKWDQIAVVVPTLALVDETRRRLSRFADRYKVNTFPSQTVAERTLFVMTQERLLDVDPFPRVGLFIIDEFYKLDSESDAERASLLNVAWDKLLRTGAQYYLTGPNVSGLAEALPSELRDSLIVTDFRTVAVDQVEVPAAESSSERLLNVVGELEGQTLVYCSSPKRVREVGQLLLGAEVGATTAAGRLAADWVAGNYDPEWIAGRCLRAGIGLHHARIPRALQHHTVRLFNTGALQYLICTSTLIEGVNTSAQNVIVLDNTLARKSLDYFTFSNIRGRAGRMFRHFVGRVFLFGVRPDQEPTTIDIPIASQSSRASIAMLLQIPTDELSDDARARVQPYLDQTTLDIDVLRANRGIDPDRQLALAEELQQDPARWSRVLSWSGFPQYDQLVTVAQLMLDHLVPAQQKGRVTARSLATRLSVVRRAQGSVPEMVDAQLPFSGDRDEAVEDVLFFNRNWMGHTFPRGLQAVERIQRDVFARYNLPSGNYGAYARQVESLFLPAYFSTLEEFGLPVPVTLKLRRAGLRGDTLDGLLLQLRRVGRARGTAALLDPFEREMVAEVIEGLGPAPASATA